MASEEDMKDIKEFWERYEKMTPEEKKAARQTQWASAVHDAAREQAKRCQDKSRSASPTS